MPPTLESIDLPLGPRIQGKVRDIWQLGSQRLIVTTDRQSAFDRVLGTIPYKGQILTAMAVWWFERTGDVIANHLISRPDPNTLLVRGAQVWPVEMVVRGYITGVTDTALWTNYAQGRRRIYGLDFPEGLHKNQRLPAPVITPTTKAQNGGHDAQISREEILAGGLVPPAIYAQMERAALGLFARGQELAAARGLILVDTKYEFGMAEGELLLVDELHTVDSSRYWEAASYAERLQAGEEPETFDKEFLRRWYVAQGYRGEGPPPPLPPELAERMSRLYRLALERLTGTPFQPDERPPEARIRENLRRAGLLA